MVKVAKTKISSMPELSHTLGVNIKHLVQISKVAGKNYEPFDMKKYGSEKWRHIDNPSLELKSIQKKINKKILRNVMLDLPSNVIGGVAKRSIINNAIPHLDQQFILSVDIKDCFPKTRHSEVYKVWKNLLGFDDNSSIILTRLTTLRQHLPQGAPTSLALSNLALLPLFEEVNKYAAENNLNFTMFVDDITISGKRKSVLKSKEVIVKIIQKYGYKIRNKKIKKMPSSKTQIVTGILVNKKASIDKDLINEIRSEIVNLAKKQKPFLSKETILGRINYIRRVVPKKGDRLLEFADILLSDDLGIEPENNTKDSKVVCNNKNCLALKP